MKLTGVKGNIFYGTSDGEFVRQRFDFCLCSFCFKQFEFNERVIHFKDHRVMYYVCLDHEPQMRKRQIDSYESKMKSDKAWDDKKKVLLSNLKLKKR